MQRRQAFTIIELLVVISIIALLIAILLPSLAGARDRARFVKWAGYSHSLRADQRIVAYWNFEQQGTGDELWNRAAGNALDQAREDIEPEMWNGDITGTSPDARWVDGRWKGKGALDFNGADEWVDIENIIDLGTNYTTAGWFRTIAVAADDKLISFDGVPGEHPLQVMNNQPRPCNLCFCSPVGPSIVDGQWHFFVTYQDGTRMKSYLNGKQILDVACGIEIAGRPRLGSQGEGSDGADGPNFLFTGQMDEMIVFKEAIEVKQIEEMYRVGRRRKKD